MAESREIIWKAPRMEYWTNDHIMKGLGINKTTYRAIYGAFELELENYSLGDRLNNITVKEQVLKASATIQKRFSYVFRDVDPAWLEECMIRWAQRINSNRKRRKVVDRPVSDSIRVPSDANPRKGTRVQVAFEDVSIFCHRKMGGSFTGMKPRILIGDSTPQSELKPDHLRYEMFIQQLKDKLDFDPNRESLWYRPSDEQGYQINESDLWQIALGEMHLIGLRRLKFIIESHPKKKPRRPYSSSNAERIAKATTCRVDDSTACNGGNEISNCVSEDSDLSSLSSRQFDSSGSETSINKFNNDTRERLRADSTAKKRKFRNDSIVNKRQKVRDD